MLTLTCSLAFLLTCHTTDTKHEYPQFIIPLLSLTFKSLETIEGEVSAEDRGTELELVNGYRYAIADISSSCLATYGVSQDMTSVLGILKEMSSHDCWQVRQASAHFLRNFQGAHKFLFTKEQEDMSLSIAISLLADDRREVSSAGMSTLTGILAMLPQSQLEELVSKYTKIANKVPTSFCFSQTLSLFVLTCCLSLGTILEEEETQGCP